MSKQKVLIAIELEEVSARQILSKAKRHMDDADDYYVLHVIDPRTLGYIPDPDMSGSMFVETYENAMHKAQQRLQQLVVENGMNAQNCIVRYGRIAHEVHELLVEGQFDLLMLGSHGWHGWKRLLGSQASSILHGVPVDTLVFKIEEKQDAES